MVRRSKASVIYSGMASRVARAEHDDEDSNFIGRTQAYRDGVGFHADSVENLHAAFHEAVEDYLETCAAVGKDPQRAFSGQRVVRVKSEVHRNATLAAELAGKSFNQ